MTNTDRPRILDDTAAWCRALPPEAQDDIAQAFGRFVMELQANDTEPTAATIVSGPDARPVAPALPA